MSSGSASTSSGRKRRKASLPQPHDPLADAFDALGLATGNAISAWKAYQAAQDAMRDEDKRMPRAMLGMRIDTDGRSHALYAHSHAEIDAGMDRMQAAVPERDIGDGATIEAFRTAAHEALDTDRLLLEMARDAAGLDAARERCEAAEADEKEAQRRVSQTPPVNLEGCALLSHFLHDRSVAREPDITVIATAARNLAVMLGKLVLDVTTLRTN